jgi:alpha-galactosidase
MRIAGVLILPLLFTLSSVSAQTTPAYVNAGSDHQSWVVGNGLIERLIQFDAKTGLSTAAWRHKLTGTDFIKRAPGENAQGAEFFFQADGAKFTGSGDAFEWVAAETHDAPPGGKVLEIKLKARTKPLEVSVFYGVYQGHPVLRKWLAITNRGSSSFTLSHLSFEAVPLRAGKPSEIQVSGFYGIQPREIFFTGRVEDTAILERNSRTGEGFVVMNEAPGYMKRTELREWGEGIEVMYDTDIFPFERTVAPGETFTTAKSSVAFFAEGRGFADPHWVIPSYTSQVLMKKGAGYNPPWIYNTYEPFYFGLPQSTVEELIPIAGRMGLDIFTLDAGWEKLWGENDIALNRYPEGLDPVRSEVERQGMRLGLWVPMAMVRPETQVYREHPEWQCRDSAGRPKTSFMGTEWGGDLPVMCMASPYREVAARRISDLISRYHLAYVKMDLTTVFNAYGEAPGCYAQGHYHQGWAESLEGIYEGIQYVTDAIYREHPDVLLDITFELWGQKHVIDYGLLAAGDLDWLSNINDATPDSAGPRQARTLLYHRSLAIPVETMLIGNLRAETPPVEERFATAIGAGPLFQGDLRKLTPQQQDWYGEKIRWFKGFRKAVPVNESFFPLGTWLQPGAASVDGFARLDREGEGMIVVFRNQASANQLLVSVPTFPDGTFRVTSRMTGASLGPFSGQQLRQGIQISVPAEHQVEVLEVRK